VQHVRFEKVGEHAVVGKETLKLKKNMIIGEKNTDLKRLTG
jgi:hypothetical protein